MQVPSNFDGCIHLRGKFFSIKCEITSLHIMLQQTFFVRTRFLYHLKKKVKNKACVEASICNAYIVEEVTTFASYYFEPHVQCKRRKAGRNDEGPIDPNCKSLSIFNYLGRASGTCTFRYLTGKEWLATDTYILLNCPKIEPYFE